MHRIAPDAYAPIASDHMHPLVLIFCTKKNRIGSHAPHRTGSYAPIASDHMHPSHRITCTARHRITCIASNHMHPFAVWRTKKCAISHPRPNERVGIREHSNSGQFSHELGKHLSACVNLCLKVSTHVCQLFRQVVGAKFKSVACAFLKYFQRA